MKVSEQSAASKTSRSYYTSSGSANRTSRTGRNTTGSKTDKTVKEISSAEKSSEEKTYWEDKAEKDRAILASFRERTEEAKQAKKNQNSNYLKSSSSGGESVGSYAALLAKAETRMEVMEVSSKVTRTLAELKMASVGAEGDEAKKLARKIRRLEKLMKRIQQKLKNLSKEEQLELRKERAIKKQEMEKAQELHKELEKRRTKRRRDDRKYAQKEMAEDMKTGSANLLDSSSASNSPSDSLSDASFSDTGGIDLSISGFEGGGMDIFV